uniref:Uncharacterized protein n=1 Tax=Ficedula albicollis TaxID=59894 RepID=A0A803VD62_FICAL
MFPLTLLREKSGSQNLGNGNHFQPEWWGWWCWLGKHCWCSGEKNVSVPAQPAHLEQGTLRSWALGRAVEPWVRRGASPAQ